MNQNNMGMMNNGMPQQQQMMQQPMQMPPTSMVSPSILSCHNIFSNDAKNLVQPETDSAPNSMASNLMVMDPLAELQANLAGQSSSRTSIPSSIPQSNGYFVSEPSMYMDSTAYMGQMTMTDMNYPMMHP
jgi:hypothetical protein